MIKDKPIRNMTIIAAVLSGLNILLNILSILAPQTIAGLFTGGSSDISFDFAGITPLLMLNACLFLPFFGICVYNAATDKMTYQKGLITVTAGIAVYLTGSLGRTFLHSFIIRTGAYKGGSDLVAALSIINNTYGILSYLNFFAVLLLISSAAIEMYATKKQIGDEK